MKTIVIGTDHGGTCAVRTLKKLDPKMEVVSYDKGNHISTLACGTPLWIKGEFDDTKGLFFASKEELIKSGIDAHDLTECIKIDAKKKEVTIKDLRTDKTFIDHYDKLIFATGTYPVVPNFKGIDHPNVSVMKHFDQATKLREVNRDPKVKNVVVIGAGYIGCELTDAFVAGKKNVTLVDFAPRITPNYYDEVFTEKLEAAMVKNKVNLQLNQKVEEFVIDQNNKLTGVKTDQGVYPCDFAIVSVGVKPQTDLLKGVVDLTDRGLVKTNDFMQTSDPDIYTLGDIAEVNNVAFAKRMAVQLAPVAIRTAVIAATNIVKGNTIKGMGFSGINALNIFDWNMASCGMTEQVAKSNGFGCEAIIFTDNDKPEFIKDHKLLTIKVVFDKKDGRILGAQMMSRNNHTDIMHVFSLGMQKGLTIGELPFVDMFFLPQYNKISNYIFEAGMKYQGLSFYPIHDEKENK